MSSSRGGSGWYPTHLFQGNEKGTGCGVDLTYPMEKKSKIRVIA